MLDRKIHLLLIGFVVMVTVLLLSWTLRYDGPVAQALTLPSDESRPVDNQHLVYQDTITNPNVIDLADVEFKEAQAEVFTDREVAAQSIAGDAVFVPPSALRSDGFPGSATGYRFSVLGGTFVGGYMRNNSADFVCMSAPVYFPEGVTLTEFSMYHLDDDPDSNLGDTALITLWRKNLASPGLSSDEVAAFFVPGTVDDTFIYRWFIATNPGTEVVSSNYGYYITFCFNPNTDLQHLVYGFKVDYLP